MLSITGSILISLSLLTTIIAIFSLVYRLTTGTDRWLNIGRWALFSSSGLMFAALLLLGVAFLTDQFQIRYVALHASSPLPIHLKLTAIWAGQEGSMLLWAFLQVLFAAYVGKRIASEKKSLFIWATIILAGLSVFFMMITLGFSNPFLTISPVPLDGQGMNPLLRHPGMIFHPPVLFVGYVGLAVPFAFALASLLVGKVDEWGNEVRRWLLVAWMALGLGIFLGARWAYDVLGWGGYWGWDPVENAGLMPWLLATGLLHGLVMQAQGKGFKVWNLVLATLSYALVLFGTFTTRSGLIQSVHAFSRSNLGPYFLALIGLVVLGTLVVLIVRRKALGESVYPEKLLSREGAFFFTLLLLMLMTLSILAGTLLPTVTGGRFSAPPAWFKQVLGPQLGALVFLMGVCPLFGRIIRSVKISLWRALPPVAGMLVGVITGFLMGFAGIGVLLGLAVIGLAGGTALGEIGVGLGVRVRRKGRLHIGGKHGLGGHLVHFGVVLMAVGVLGTQNYATEQNLTLAPGESVSAQGYTLVYTELVQETSTDHQETWAVIDVYRGQNFLKTLNPQISYYPAYRQTVAEPAIRAGLREDLYLVLFQYDPSGTISLTVKVNPLSSFLWVGGMILLIGGVLAWWPKSSDADDPGKQRKKGAMQIGVLVGLILVIIMVVTLWGDHFESSFRDGRPLPGSSAPDFSAVDIHGNQISLTDMEDAIVVINFWATWCPQCEDELVDFQAVWEDYGTQGVWFVGVAMEDDLKDVVETARRLQISYPLIVEKQRSITSLYGVTAVPETFIIAPQGDVVDFRIGTLSEEDLRKILDELLD